MSTNYDKGHAEKISKLIGKFYKIAKDRFKNNVFNIYRQRVNVNVGNEDIFKEQFLTAVICVKGKSGKKHIWLPYFGLRGSPEEVRNEYHSLPNSFFYLYHKNLLHGYAELFLFHDELLNPPDGVEKAYLETKKRKNICDRFTEVLLNL